MNIGDKITIKTAPIVGEVIGVYPAGQAGQLKARYSVMIDGRAEMLSEEMVDLLFDKYDPLVAMLTKKQEEKILVEDTRPEPKHIEPKKEEPKHNVKRTKTKS